MDFLRTSGRGTSGDRVTPRPRRPSGCQPDNGRGGLVESGAVLGSAVRWTRRPGSTQVLPRPVPRAYRSRCRRWRQYRHRDGFSNRLAAPIQESQAERGPWPIVVATGGAQPGLNPGPWARGGRPGRAPRARLAPTPPRHRNRPGRTDIGHDVSLPAPRHAGSAPRSGAEPLLASPSGATRRDPIAPGPSGPGAGRDLGWVRRAPARPG